MKLGKKANMDNLTIPAMLFLIATVIVIGWMILDAGLTAFSTDATANSLLNNGKTMFLRLGGSTFVYIAMALIIFNMFGAFLMITHPIFVIVDLFLMPFSVIIGVVMSNAYESSIYLMSATANFPIMNFIMLHLPVIIIVADILCAIAAYAFVKQ
jgi:hypothetical protein